MVALALSTGQIMGAAALAAVPAILRRFGVRAAFGALALLGVATCASALMDVDRSWVAMFGFGLFGALFALGPLYASSFPEILDRLRRPLEEALGEMRDGRDDRPPR